MGTKRLYRDPDHAMLGGVCAGLANRFNLDPTLVRVVTILLGLVTAGTTVLIYIALWIIMPVPPPEPREDTPARRPSREELTGEVREAGTRVAEAARILGRAAQQAADEISQIPGRRSTPPPATPSTVGGESGGETPEPPSPSGAPGGAPPWGMGSPPPPPPPPVPPPPPGTPYPPPSTEEEQRQPGQQQP